MNAYEERLEWRMTETPFFSRLFLQYFIIVVAHERAEFDLFGLVRLVVDLDHVVIFYIKRPAGPNLGNSRPRQLSIRASSREFS